MDIIDEESKKAAKAYEFSVAGIKLKLNSTFFALAIPLITTLGGASWGAFQAYQDYMNMKAKIEKYVSPDLTGFDKRIAVLEENSTKQTEFTRIIKDDLKNDLRRLDDLLANVERTAKTDQRDTYATVREMQNEIRVIKRELDNQIKVMENQIKENDHETDLKIKRVLDNPLSNK